MLLAVEHLSSVPIPAINNSTLIQLYTPTHLAISYMSAALSLNALAKGLFVIFS
jgi:hypothetical protein